MSEDNTNQKKTAENAYDSVVRSLTNRAKHKRKIKLVENQLIQFAFGESDSEDDEDFTVEDEDVNSDDSNIGDVSDDADSDSAGNDQSSDAEPKEQEEKKNMKLCDILSAIENTDSLISVDIQTGQDGVEAAFNKLLICGICLESEDSEKDEILECDNCGIMVHEGCYGDIESPDNDDKSDSDAPTEPWFCESCKAGVSERPFCELCPNSGGIYKQTNTGKWVHLICALYTPCVGFRDVSKLQTVVLEDVKASAWGGSECMFCLDENFSRTGVCITCDAGLCKTTFHVTCAQRNGFLSDIPDRDETEEDESPDLLYAHCKLHSEKLQMKKRRDSWLAFESRVSKFRLPDDEIERERIIMSLDTAKSDFKEFRRQVLQTKTPVNEISRFLSSCPEACLMLAKKAEILGLLKHPGYNVKAAVVSGRISKHEAHLSADFVNYFFKREMQVNEIENSLKTAKPLLMKLENEQKTLTRISEDCQKRLENVLNEKELLLSSCRDLHQQFCKLAGKNCRLPDVLKPKNELASKAKIAESTKLLNAIVHRCATCETTADQHLLIKCESCQNHYHLACVDPPLTRIPKKSDNYVWQCTECDSTDESESEVELEEDNEGARRKRRAVKEPEKYTPEIISNKNQFKESLKRKNSNSKTGILSKKKKKKKHSESEIDKKKKDRSFNNTDATTLAVKKKVKKIYPAVELFDDCCLCNKSGDKSTLVKCDECRKCYHFQTCLDPPYAKTPKSKYYGWICQDCDESDEENAG